MPRKRSGGPMERMVVFRCGASLHQEAGEDWGRGGMCWRWKTAKLIVEGWQPPSLRLFKWQHSEVTLYGPVKPSYTLCGPLLPDPVQAELPTLTVNSFPGQEHRFIGGEIAFNLAGICSRPSKDWEQCCSREMVSVSISFLYILLELLNKPT